MNVVVYLSDAFSLCCRLILIRDRDVSLGTTRSSDVRRC
jgi:hypothetical protein